MTGGGPKQKYEEQQRQEDLVRQRNELADIHPGEWGDRREAVTEQLEPWLNGEPYYCALCGAGGHEFMACEEPDCKLESRAEAMERKARREVKGEATP